MTDVVSIKLAKRKCYYMQFTLLTTPANQHLPIILGNRNKLLYYKIPDSLSESQARTRLDQILGVGSKFSLGDGGHSYLLSACTHKYTHQVYNSYLIIFRASIEIKAG